MFVDVVVILVLIRVINQVTDVGPSHIRSVTLFLFLKRDYDADYFLCEVSVL